MCIYLFYIQNLQVYILHLCKFIFEFTKYVNSCQRLAKNLKGADLILAEKG